MNSKRSDPLSDVPHHTSSHATPVHDNIVRGKLTDFVGISTLPNQWHRKSMKKVFDFNIMVVGASGLGKSTLISSLFNTPMYLGKELYDPTKEIPETVEIKSFKVNIEENGVRLNLTVVDTPGFGDLVNNTDSWEKIVRDIDRRFNLYLEAENQPKRGPIPDNRIHACIYFIQPTGHSLKALDVTIMQKLHHKVNLIPVIAKSDTLTQEEIETFKKRIKADLASQYIEVFEPPKYENDDDETIAENEELIDRCPFAIVGSNQLVKSITTGKPVRGRAYPWGAIEIENEDHCDFVHLRKLLIGTHLEELRENTANVLYEDYRTQKLSERGIEQDPSVFGDPEKGTNEQEEAIAKHKAKLARMESEMKFVFDKKVAEKETALQNSEAELYECHREMKETLEKQRLQLEEKKYRILAGRELVEEKKPKKGFLR